MKRGEPFVRADLFGGTGEVQIWNLLPPGAEPFRAVLYCELAPSGEVGAHRQEQFPEIVLCKSGEGQIAVDGKVQEFLPGVVVHLPLGSVLALRNTSEETPLGYLIIKAG